MGGRCLDHKFTLEANEFQGGLDKPHEHVIDLKAESEIQDVIKKSEFRSKSSEHLGERDAGKTADYCECLSAPPSFPLKGRTPQAPLGSTVGGQRGCRCSRSAAGHMQ